MIETMVWKISKRMFEVNQTSYTNLVNLFDFSNCTMTDKGDSTLVSKNGSMVCTIVHESNGLHLVTLIGEVRL